MNEQYEQLNIFKKQTNTKLELALSTPGATEDTVSVFADEETNKLTIEASGYKVPKFVSDVVELNINKTIDVDKRFDVLKSVVKTKAGITYITIPVAKRIKQIKPKQEKA